MWKGVRNDSCCLYQLGSTRFCFNNKEPQGKCQLKKEICGPRPHETHIYLYLSEVEERARKEEEENNEEPLIPLKCKLCHQTRKKY